MEQETDDTTGRSADKSGARQGIFPELPDTPAGRLFAHIRDLFSDVPQEEWDNWPDDMIEDLDHYLYGMKKRADRPKRTVEDILEECVQRVPPEEWANLPPDLIERLDYYTAGADLTEPEQ